MPIKQILDLASAALPSLVNHYNDQGEYVGGEGDILAIYVAQSLIFNYKTAPSLKDSDIISYLTGFIYQAITELTMVCKALETGDTTTQGA
jgi:hypothetical protein